MWSLDECHFQQHGTRCRMWVPPEETDPIVLHAPTRRSIACFGAVSLCRGTFVWRFSTPFNAATFQVYLSQLLRHRPRHKQMIVLLDNARYHHAKLLRPWLHQYRELFALLFLPPYSPQLAPIERVWKLARRLATHNRYFPDLDALRGALEPCFDRWRKPNAALTQLCGIT